MTQTPETQLKTAEARLAEALALREAGDFVGAVGRLRELLEEAGFVRGWMELGRTLRRLGEREGALEAFGEAERLEPEHLPSRIEGAIELRALERFEEAEQKLLGVLQINSKQPAALFQLGEVYRVQRRFEEAIAQCQKALNVAPNHVSAKTSLAIAYRELGEWDIAEQQLQLLLQNNLLRPAALVQLGEVYRVQRRFEEAIAQYQKALEAKPDNPWAEMNMAIAYRESGQWDVAEQQLNNILDINPNHFQAYIHQGILARWRDEHGKALDWFRKAVEYATDAAQKLQAQLKVCETLQELDQLVEAHELAQQLDTDHAGNWRVIMVLGDLFRRQQAFDSAAELYQKVLSIQPGHRPASIQLSHCLYDLGQSEAALQTLELAKYGPATNITVQIRKVEILRLLHRLDEAEQILQYLQERFPKDSRVLMQWGYLERQRGQRQRALGYFRQAADHPLQAHQGLAAQFCAIEELRDLDRLDEAKTEIQQVLAKHPQHRRANMILASIFYRQLELGTAAEVYRKLLQFNPHNTNAQFELARVLSEMQQQTTEAVAHLQVQYHQSKRPELRILMRLGQLAEAQEDYPEAQRWYEQARELYPHRAQVYSALAEVMYRQAEIEGAIALLSDARQEIPQAPELPLKLASLQMRLGYPVKSLRILEEVYQRFPHQISVLLQLCHLHLQLGEFENAEGLLAGTGFDHGNWRKQVALLRAEMALRRFQPQMAEPYLREAIAIAPATPHEHNRLAQTYLLQAEPLKAYEQVKLATDLLKLKMAPGQTNIPLKDHVAVLINQMRMNPAMLEQLQAAMQEQGKERLIGLGTIVAQEPTYLGAGLCLMQALRQQDIFAEWRRLLPVGAVGLPQIPKRIVQFWDSPKPPEEIAGVMRSWVEMNPDYEYVRFSLQRAIAFLQEYYDADVLKAFQLCGHVATQADLFRLAYLNKMGGFYADADDRCLVSLDDLVESNAELVVYQEEYASIGNNFLGCIPNQSMIQMALYQAVENLLNYTTEGPWFQTGPGLMTGCVGLGLVPYLSHLDFRMWPRLVVLSQEALRGYVWPHLSLPYKHTEKSWVYQSYRAPNRQNKRSLEACSTER